MITHIHGKLVEKNPSYVVIDCQGVGYLLRISLQTYSKLSNEEHCRLFTYLSIKEDAHTLYGFADQDERQLFSQLISVSGVGPNTAQMILSSLTPHDIQQAISSNNVGLLQSVKGIGGKTAQRIILDLKDKIMKLNLSTNHEVSYNTTKEEALSALTMLGFSKGSIEKIIDKELQENPSQLVEEVVKKVLKKI